MQKVVGIIVHLTLLLDAVLKCNLHVYVLVCVELISSVRVRTKTVLYTTWPKQIHNLHVEVVILWWRLSLVKYYLRLWGGSLWGIKMLHIQEYFVLEFVQYIKFIQCNICKHQFPCIVFINWRLFITYL